MSKPEYTSFNRLGKRVRRVCERRGLSMRTASQEAGFSYPSNFFAAIAGRFGTVRGTGPQRVKDWLKMWEGK